MTEQYLIGQLSVLLGDLPASPASRTCAAVRDLRRTVECAPLVKLPALAREAIRLTDVICWAALARGDVEEFVRDAAAAAALADFTDAAGLLSESIA